MKLFTRHQVNQYSSHFGSEKFGGIEWNEDLYSWRSETFGRKMHAG